jgi:hypothetical protein
MAGVDAQKAPVSTAMKILIITSPLPITASPPLGIGHFVARASGNFLGNSGKSAANAGWVDNRAGYLYT